MRPPRQRKDINRFRYSAEYREVVVLRDGTRIIVRAVHPQDASLIERGFEHMSPDSRYKRFFSTKSHLERSELHYLSDVDFVDHVALGAVRVDECGHEHPLGIARFVRLGEDCAEPAVAVVDDAQGMGLGTLLLSRLSAAAWERGIRRFRCELLVGNSEMQHLLAALDPDARFSFESQGVLRAELHVPVPGPPELDRASDSHAGRILAASATQSA